MSSSITISSISGTPPYTVYVCNTLGTGCVLISSGLTTYPVAFTLPSIFDSAPAVLVKIVDARNCITTSLEFCSENNYLKVVNESPCGGTYNVTSGGTINGYPYFEYVNTAITHTILISWNGIDRWLVEDLTTSQICLELVYNRTLPIGTIAEWTDVDVCTCTGVGDFYTEYYF